MMSTALSTPTALSELVEYQPDAVISRVVFRNPGGTLSVFAFDEGQGLTEHSNPNDATILLLDGTLDVLIGTEGHTLHPGECLRLPAAVPHTIVAGGRFKMLLTLLRTAPPG
jgi:quercetin dioxygenase-like cupin family protein